VATKKKRMPDENDNSKFVTPKEVAGHYGVTVNTVRQWIKDERVPSVQPAGPGGRVFIPRDKLA